MGIRRGAENVGGLKVGTETVGGMKIGTEMVYEASSLLPVGTLVAGPYTITPSPALVTGDYSPSYPTLIVELSDGANVLGRQEWPISTPTQFSFGTFSFRLRTAGVSHAIISNTASSSGKVLRIYRQAGS